MLMRAALENSRFSLFLKSTQTHRAQSTLFSHARDKRCATAINQLCYCYAYFCILHRWMLARSRSDNYRGRRPAPAAGAKELFFSLAASIILLLVLRRRVRVRARIYFSAGLVLLRRHTSRVSYIFFRLLLWRHNCFTAKTKLHLVFLPVKAV